MMRPFAAPGDIPERNHVATRPDDHNSAFLDRMRRVAEPDGLPLRLHSAEDLHEKGILGDWFYLSGSMNFTESGIRINDELLTFELAEAVVAQARLHFRQHYGALTT